MRQETYCVVGSNENMVISKSEVVGYVFQSERLGFRNWHLSDLEAMSAINADPMVMEFFPSIQTREQTLNFIVKMQKQFLENGLCYFAVDKLNTKELIGYIGISIQFFELDFSPCSDIGWRIKSSEWNKGYATEGAKRFIEYAFEELQLNKIYSIAPKINVKSEHIMKKIGMTKVATSNYPKPNDDSLKDCIVYEIEFNQ